MPNQYTNEDYKNAIEEYRHGDYSMIQSEIKFLSRCDVPSYNKETFFFIDEALKLAKQWKHEDIIAALTELSNKIDGDSTGFIKTSILEDALVTEHDCVVAINRCLENGQYQSILTKIVEFIRKKKQFHVALVVLQAIDKSVFLGKSNSDLNQKEDVALYFIERMDEVIKNDIQVKSIIGLHYKSESWDSFKNDDYVHYTDLVKKLKKDFRRNK